MKGTVTVDLAELDEIRSWAAKYKEVNQGLEGYVKHLKAEEIEAQKKEKKSLLPYTTLVESIKAYNATNPEHPFTL